MTTWDALGYKFTIETSRAELDAYLSDLMADLPRGTGKAHHRFRLEGPNSDGLWEAQRDGLLIERPTTAPRALALLLWNLNRAVVEDREGQLVLHAGGVVVSGLGVLLPGAMEAGKSTLVAGMLRGGADYLSDEAVSIGPDPTTLRGYGKAIALDPGSWSLFPDLKPTVPSAIRPFLPEQWQIRASSLPGVESHVGAEARLIVLPTYVPDATIDLTRLRGAEALGALAECAFPTSLGSRGLLKRLTMMLNRVPCYRLVYSDLPQGVEQVTRLAQRIGPRVSPSAVAPQYQTSEEGDVPVTWARHVRRRPDAEIMEVAGDYLIHVAGSDALHLIDEIGVALWDRLDGTVPLSELVTDLAIASGRPHARIEASVLGFMNRMHELDLLAGPNDCVP